MRLTNAGGAKSLAQVGPQSHVGGNAVLLSAHPRPCVFEINVGPAERQRLAQPKAGIEKEAQQKSELGIEAIGRLDDSGSILVA